MSFQFDSLKYNYPTTRKAVFGRKGMVCTSQPLAAQAGLDILKKGGNAVDAAIATAACMTVLEPTSNGIGGDGFALVWMKDKLYGLNASGPAPMGIDPEELRAKYGDTLPKRGWVPVTVPGIPSAWASLSERFGKLPFEELLEPAIRYAEEGYPVSPVISRLWDNAYNEFKPTLKDDYFKYWFETFCPKDRAPKPGEMVYLKDHAKTLRELAATKCESFYRGAIAEKIDAFSRECGAYRRKEDLAPFHAEWVEPISTNYKGYDVWEIPPNGYGITVLMALNILKGFEFKDPHSAETYHKQLEAMKLAFIDSQKYVADPRFMKTTAEKMLDQGYADSRRALIGDTARMPEAGDPNCGGTVYLCAADEEGNMISYIQSNYNGFGSCVVIPETGICLHNRGRNFYLDPASGNCIAPGKKPAHTIIPGFLTKDGKAVGPFGVMGAFMQPQGQVQVLMNTIDFHMNPQEALDAPRWQWTSGMNVEVERAFPYAATEEMIRRGHKVTVPAESLLFGRGQIIWRDEDGVLCGGTESRTDGTVAAW